MTAVVAAKAALRRERVAARDALPEEFRAEAARLLAQWADRPELRQILPGPGGTIAAFLPIRSEIGLGALMQALAAAGYRLALPRIAADGLVFRAYSPGDALAAGPFGTREPPEAAPVAVPDAILAPLLAFDAEGRRLGYGKAYYDRAFARLPDAMRIGVGYAVQEVPAVPAAPHDAPLDAILTERGLRITSARAARRCGVAAHG